MSTSAPPTLVGKVVAVKYGSGDRDFDYIEAVSLELQAGRHFLVGKTVKTPWNDTDEVRLCVAWDKVTSYYEFDSIEECHNCMASWHRLEKKTKSRFSWPL